MLLGFYLWRVEPLLRPRLEKPPAPNFQSDPIPADLLQYTQGFDEAWARDEAMDKCVELYQKLGNWDRVRMAIAANDKKLTAIEVVDEG